MVIRCPATFKMQRNILQHVNMRLQMIARRTNVTCETVNNEMYNTVFTANNLLFLLFVLILSLKLLMFDKRFRNDIFKSKGT